jgi:RNA polymerase sigma-70 factor (ECF subfamily)
MNSSSRDEKTPALPLTDPELVALALRKHRMGVEGLVKKYLPSLFGFLRSLSVPPDLVEDIAQETFMKALQNLERYDVSRPFATWLFTIGRRTFIDEWRKTKKEHPMGLTAFAVDGASPADIAQSRWTVQELLDRISDEAKLVLELRIFIGLSFTEMAEVTGETENALRVRFHRTLAFLRKGVSSGKEAS